MPVVLVGASCHNKYHDGKNAIADSLVRTAIANVKALVNDGAKVRRASQEPQQITKTKIPLYCREALGVENNCERDERKE